MANQNNEIKLDDLIGKNVRVHFNLHKKLWTVIHKSKIIGHVKHVTIRPTKFHVNENGRQRVIKKKQKEVHAWIWGVVQDFEDHSDYQENIDINYNPYALPYFYRCDNYEHKSEALPENTGCLHFNYRTRRGHEINRSEVEK